MAIIDRIRAHGGEVIRSEWRFTLRRGRLTDTAIEWLRGNMAELYADQWPEYDAWSERAAIKEFDGGMTRYEAERQAFEEVMGC